MWTNEQLVFLQRLEQRKWLFGSNGKREKKNTHCNYSVYLLKGVIAVQMSLFPYIINFWYLFPVVVSRSRLIKLQMINKRRRITNIHRYSDSDLCEH